MSKSIKISNVTFTLKDGRLYGSGSGYYSTTKHNEKVKLDLTNEKQIDLCIKNIEQGSLPNYLAVYDRQDQSYDIRVYDDKSSQDLIEQNGHVILTGIIFAFLVYAIYSYGLFRSKQLQA